MRPIGRARRCLYWQVNCDRRENMQPSEATLFKKKLIVRNAYSEICLLHPLPACRSVFVDMRNARAALGVLASDIGTLAAQQTEPVLAAQLNAFRERALRIEEQLRQAD